MTEKVPAEPNLDTETLKMIDRGFAEFNSGKFFECHDTLEEVWQRTRGPARDFFQGLIQISVGFYHLRNGNLAGAHSQLEKALKNLSQYGESYAGMDLASLCSEVQSWLSKISSGRDLGCTVANFPQFQFKASFPGPRSLSENH